MLLLYFRDRVFIPKPNGQWEMLSITTVHDLRCLGNRMETAICQKDQETARKGKSHFLARNTNPGTPEHDFVHPLRIIRNLDPKFFFIMQAALYESIPLTFRADPGDIRRLNCMTESETNARQSLTEVALLTALTRPTSINCSASKKDSD